MADNTTLNSGTGGDVIATDDIAGVKHQRVKVEFGTDGNATDVSASDPLPVTAAVTSIAAGTNNIGDVDVLTLPSLPSGSNNIGDVDVLTVPSDPFGANADAASATGSISAKLRFIASTGIPVTSVASHAVTNAGTFAVQESGTHVLTDDNTFTPATTKVVMAGYTADETSTDSVDEGDGGAARMTLDRKVIVTTQPHTTGGVGVYRSLDLDESEEQVKGSAGQVYGMWVTNDAASERYVKFYDDTAAAVVVGTHIPRITIGVPGNSSDQITGIFGVGGLGIQFDVAITIAATTGPADNNTGAPQTNDLIVNIFYK